MKKTFTFNASTIASTASKMNDNAFDRSVEAFKNKDYKASFHALLDYVNGTFRSKYGNADGTEFNVPHGSIIVTVKIEGDLLKVTAPFLSLPEKNRIPLLRQVASLNFNNLDLAQVILKDDRLFFEYACPMTLVEPYKTYYVLQEICRTGDRYDDEFVTKFEARRIREPEVTPYDQKTVDSIYQVIQDSCQEWAAAITHFESARQYGYAWNVTVTTLLKVLYYAHPQGQLLNDLNRAVWELDREDIPLPEVVAIGKQAVERLQNIPKEKLAENLYFIETFIPDKRRSNLKNIQENFENTYNSVTEAMEQENYLLCCMMITHQFYNMYFYNNVQDDVNAVVVSALEKASAKPFNEAAPVLYMALHSIMEGKLVPVGESSGGGIFKKLFKKS